MRMIPRAVKSFRAGVGAAKISWANPAERDSLDDEYGRRVAHYTFLWNAYLNTIFVENNKWEGYLARRGLYKRTICVYNPVRRLVDFYAAQVYPGLLSEDGSPMVTEYGVTRSTAIPLSGDTPIPLRKAIAQCWQWSNWQENMGLWITYCAAVGDGPVEIIDDWERGKIEANVLWPGDITDVRFDLTGNVISYTKEIPYIDENTNEYHVMTKVVNKKKIETFRDEEPFGFNGLPASYDNPYGFCPMVWNKHRGFGHNVLPGSPAVRDWTKIEELNSQVAQINAYIRKQSVSPQILAGVGEVVPLPLVVDGKEVDPDDLLLLLAERVGSVQSLQGNLNLEAARGQARDQLAEIEADHPEIVMYHMMRQMSNVSGEAIKRLMGDVLGLIRLTTQGYDRRSISLFQMMVAIGGMRVKEGQISRKSGWRDQTEAQKLFLPYNLESYRRQELNFAILERSLTPPTELEQSNATLMRYNAIGAGIDAGFPRDWQLHIEGTTDESIQVLHRYQENAAVMGSHLQELAQPALPTELPELPKPIIIPQGAQVAVPPTPPGLMEAYNQSGGLPNKPETKTDKVATIVTEKEREESRSFVRKKKQ
jgi:hypothetical protein